MRHVVNFGLLFSFLTLAVTGVMSYLLPFRIETARVHILFGAATLVLVGLHLAGRVAYFRGQVAGKGKAVSKPVLGVIAAGFVYGGWAERASSATNQLAGNGSRNSRFWMNSTPAINPRPRTSPIIGCFSLSSCRRSCM